MTKKQMLKSITSALLIVTLSFSSASLLATNKNRAVISTPYGLTKSASDLIAEAEFIEKAAKAGFGRYIIPMVVTTIDLEHLMSNACDQEAVFDFLQQLYNKAIDTNNQRVLTELTLTVNLNGPDIKKSENCLERLAEGYTPNEADIFENEDLEGLDIDTCKCLDENNNVHGAVKGPVNVGEEIFNATNDNCKKVCCYRSNYSTNKPVTVSWLYNFEPQKFCSEDETSSEEL